MRCLRYLLIVWLAAILAAAQKPPAKQHARPNIILITLDTTRADRMGFLGSDRGLTPNLDALAKQGAVFTHAYSQVPLTTPSHAAILTGTYPQFNQVRELQAPLNPKIPYLPDLLRRSGYQTGAFLGSIILAPKLNAQGFDRGFSTYDAPFRPQKAGENRYEGEERRADAVVDSGLRWLAKKRPGPFFLWLHFYDPHAPYDPPEPYKTKYTKEPYDGEIAYVDSVVGRFISSLKAQKLYDSAVIAVMADHGEAFGEHGERFHGIFLYDTTIHVPFFVKLPGAQFASTRVESRVGLVDVAPTLLEEAGLHPTMQGHSVLPLIRTAVRAGDSKQWGERKIYSESEYPSISFGWSPLYALRSGKYLYVAAPQRELYDQERDPAGEHNLAVSSGAIADTLLSQLSDLQSKTSGNAPVTADLQSRDSESLAALGYLAGPGAVLRGVADVGGVDPKSKIVDANLLHSGLLHAAAADTQRAIEELEQALADEPNARMAYFALGRCYLNLKDYDKALPALRKAAETMPGLAGVQYELGRTLVELKRWDEAAPVFENAIRTNPNEAEWHFDLAAVYERMRRFPDAVDQFRKAIELNPEHFRANLLLGRLLGMKGDAGEALPLLQKAAKLQPDSTEAHMYLANVYAMLHQPERSEQEREVVERLKSGSPK